jgi:hypothetical protein
MIYVRSRKDRLAYEEIGGRLIPNDVYVPVALTPYIDRLLNKHQDIELRPEINKTSTQKKPVVATEIEKD